MSALRIIGIVLARNEDLFVAQAVRNAAAFCDEWILCDHGSTDRTAAVFRELTSEFPNAHAHQISHPRESHDLLKPFCGTSTWVFGVDGDEIYDAEGLRRLRERILSGEFANDWMLLGNVLHVTALAEDRMTATGHLSPPCRSMTKLYNFAAIESWDGDCVERLHGGAPVFREGFSENLRRNLHEETDWDSSDFRCLHLCFLPRSSSHDRGDVRLNIMETYGAPRLQRWGNAIRTWCGFDVPASWKKQKYRRGPEVTVDARPFF